MEIDEQIFGVSRLAEWDYKWCVAPTPNYYHGLSGFRELFETGLPVLTYHKVGPRPPRVLLKGLYVSPLLFARQLAELHDAGFTAPPYNSVLGPATGQGRQVLVTFDDGFANVFRHALAPLAAHRFRAIQFLVADQIGKSNEWDEREGEAREPLMDEAEVRDWLAAGHIIGSHTLTHPHLTHLSTDDARAEIVASREKLEDRFGVAVEHFCYPYGDWNPLVRDLVVSAGYRTACTTEPGMNTPETPRYELRRWTARYPSRNWRAVGAWIRRLATR